MPICAVFSTHLFLTTSTVCFLIYIFVDYSSSMHLGIKPNTEQNSTNIAQSKVIEKKCWTEVKLFFDFIGIFFFWVNINKLWHKAAQIQHKLAQTFFFLNRKWPKTENFKHLMCLNQDVMLPPIFTSFTLFKECINVFA